MPTFSFAEPVQLNSEDIFASRYKSQCNRIVFHGWEIVDYEIDTGLGDGYNITTTISHVSLGRRTVRYKYLVGADGGQSTVRRLAGIDMEGNETTYSVKQKVAATLQKDEYILLGGDAGHTHSSVFAQGMNTGVHDATNLVWKLAGALKGWYEPETLATYATERRAAALKLISIDKLAAAAVSGDVPPERQRAGLTAEDALHSILETYMSFNIGLGDPDALLYAPGPLVPIRLHSITHRDNNGRWSLLIFAGCYHVTRQKFAGLREKVTTPGTRLTSWNHLLNISTIMMGAMGSAWDVFDGPALGKLYFDTESLAHGRYGVYPTTAP
ncbi:hypothetical protein DL770_002887 [Monosporascus sp. CRB-9-2]|nr:hypothetical protein DL770_002887 [Monosporascus sp. CRB-9-2]